MLQEGDQKLVYLGHYAAGAPAGDHMLTDGGGGHRLLADLRNVEQSMSRAKQRLSQGFAGQPPREEVGWWGPRTARASTPGTTSPSSTPTSPPPWLGSSARVYWCQLELRQ